MKRPRKRFTSEKAIIKAIDAAHEDARAALALAEQQHAEAETLFRESAQMPELLADGAIKRGRELKQLARANEERAKRLVDTKAAKLGEALATFKTELLFGDDRSVPV